MGKSHYQFKKRQKELAKKKKKDEKRLRKQELKALENGEVLEGQTTPEGEDPTSSTDEAEPTTAEATPPVDDPTLEKEDQ